MKACEFPEASHRLGAPKDWDVEKQGECFTLPVQVTEDGRCVSLWTPDAAERALIAEGHPIALSIVGGQPPVMLSVSEGHRVQEIDDHKEIHRTGWRLARRRLRQEILELFEWSGDEPVSKDRILALVEEVEILN